MRIRSRRLDLAKDLRPGMKHRFTFYRDILIKSLRESSVDSHLLIVSTTLMSLMVAWLRVQ